MKILLLTQWFEPEPTFKGHLFAKELQRQGFDVEVVTGFPNYPGGKLYPGYKIQFIKRDFIDGVKITRLPLFPSHDQSPIGRVLNYASFALSSLLYGLFGAKKPEVIYAYHPPLTVGMAAVLIRLFRRVPVVYDIQDMWPDTLRATGMVSNERLLNIVARICQSVYRSVDYLVVLSPGFRRLLVERGVPDGKVDVIYNWCDEASLANPVGAPQADFPASDRFTIVYAGNMGKAQSLETLLAAAELVRKTAPDICFVLIGGGVEVNNLKQLVQKLHLDNVLFLPPVPMSDIGGVLSQADALLVHLRKDPLFTITIPSKTQAYMAVGKPLLMAVEGDVADLVKAADCGVIAEPENPESIAEAACALYGMSLAERKAMAENSKNYYQSELSLQVGVGKFADVFKRVVKEWEDA